MSRRAHFFCCVVALLTPSSCLALDNVGKPAAPFEIEFLPLQSFAEFSQAVNPEINGECYVLN